MNDEITIVIADDHPIVRQGLRQTIEEDKRLRVVAEVSNGREAVAAIQIHSPQVTILDIDMPLMNGFDAARTIHQMGLVTEIIFLIMHRDEEIFNEAIDLGAKASSSRTVRWPTSSNASKRPRGCTALCESCADIVSY